MLRKLSASACLFLFILTALWRHLEGQECSCTPPIELKAGYFLYSDKQMRDVYKNGGYEIQLSSRYALRDTLYLYGSIGFQGASGHSTHFHQKSNFWQIPVDLGLRQYFPLNCTTNFYVTAGPRLFYAHQHNHSDYVNKNIGKLGLGIFLNAGFDFIFADNYKVTLFTEYSYQSVNPSSSKQGVETRHVNVGGFCFGGGITF